MGKERRDPFRDHVHELLAPLGDVRVRAMFGGYGIYAGERMFALIAEGTLYLKVDEQNEARFLEAGLEPFVYHSPRGPMAMAYRRAPEAGLDDGEVLRAWAEGAISAAVRAAAKKPAAKKPAAKAAVKKPAAKAAVKKPAAKAAVKKPAAKAAVKPAARKPTSRAR
jgi:DNA transformation protein